MEFERNRNCLRALNDFIKPYTDKIIAMNHFGMQEHI
jgi:hypothetical protein